MVSKNVPAKADPEFADLLTEKFRESMLRIEKLRTENRRLNRELAAAREHAEHIRSLDQQDAERRLRAQAERFSITEARLNATIRRLTCRVSEIERTWLWRLRLLFSPAEPIPGSFTSYERDPLEESVNPPKCSPRSLSDLLARRLTTILPDLTATVLKASGLSIPAQVVGAGRSWPSSPTTSPCCAPGSRP